MFQHLTEEIEALGHKVRDYLAGSGDKMAGEFHSAVVALHAAGISLEQRIEKIEAQLGIEHQNATPVPSPTGDGHVESSPGVQSGGSEGSPGTGDPQSGGGGSGSGAQSEPAGEGSKPAT